MRATIERYYRHPTVDLERKIVWSSWRVALDRARAIMGRSMLTDDEAQEVRIAIVLALRTYNPYRGMLFADWQMLYILTRLSHWNRRNRAIRVPHDVWQEECRGIREGTGRKRYRFIEMDAPDAPEYIHAGDEFDIFWYDFRQAVAELSRNDPLAALCAVYAFVYEYSQREISHALHLYRPNVKAAIERARQFLRERL